MGGKSGKKWAQFEEKANKEAGTLGNWGVGVRYVPTIRDSGGFSISSRTWQCQAAHVLEP